MVGSDKTELRSARGRKREHGPHNNRTSRCIGTTVSLVYYGPWLTLILTTFLANFEDQQFWSSTYVAYNVGIKAPAV